jgi:hypothetical protein
MAEQGDGTPDDVVFQDEGSFFDPDAHIEERGPSPNHPAG